jgi:hypothetical protein
MTKHKTDKYAWEMKAIGPEEEVVELETMGTGTCASFYDTL